MNIFEVKKGINTFENLNVKIIENIFFIKYQ